MTIKSTMKGKQNVSYRTCDDALLLHLASLPRTTAELYVELLKHIDIHDNCVQVDSPTLREHLRIDRSNFSKRINNLTRANLIKEVIDIAGTARLMLNPEMVWSTSRDKLRFGILMYQYGSHVKATSHMKDERSSCGHINPIDGSYRSNFRARLDDADSALHKRYLYAAANDSFKHASDTEEFAA